MHYLALCCIVRDEDPFLKEWLTFHALLGVEHFYIYDNMSENPVLDVLGDYIDPVQVTVIPIEGQARQIHAYLHCLQNYGAGCKWIGFIDLDEFMCPQQDTDLRVMLSEFEEYGGLAVTWNMFSSGGHMTRPGGPVIKNYTTRFLSKNMQTNLHIKSFVQPTRVAALKNPHFFYYKAGEFCVNESHFPVPDSPFTFSHGKLVKLNHYYYLSQQDFEKKTRRSRAGKDKRSFRSLDMFYAQTMEPVETDEDILRFLPALEEALARKKMYVPPVLVPEGSGYESYRETALGFLNAGQRENAAICLCRASLEPGDADHAPYAQMSDLWVIRARIARLGGQFDRAERFLRAALRLEETPLIFTELIALRRAQNSQQEADELQDFLRHRLAIS